MNINLIIDAPKLIQDEIELVTGAESIAKKIIKAVINNNKNAKNHSLISSANKNYFATFIKNNYSNIHVDLYRYYNAYQAFIASADNTLAFIPGISISNLLNMRNITKANIPVVGLVHNISQPRHFDALKNITKTSTAIDSIICPSESSRKIIENFCELNNLDLKLNLPVIPYGVDLNKFQPHTDKKTLRKKYNIPESKTVVLHLSRINPFTKMDIMPMIRNFEVVSKNNPKALLLIVGQAHAKEYFSQVQDYVKSQNLTNAIQFIDDVNHDFIEEYYQLSDVFVSLTDNISENFGLNVIEAMACGLPIIISDIAGHKDLITDGEEGFYIPTISSDFVDLDYFFNTCPIMDYGDITIQSLALDNLVIKEKMNLLINDIELRNKLGNTARSKATNNYDMKMMIANYQAHFEKMLKKANDNQITNFPDLPHEKINKVYSHNLKNSLKKNTKIKLTTSGQKAIDEQKTPPIFEKHLELFPLVGHVLNCLNNAELSFQELQANLDNIDETVLAFNILFLAKHDFIAILR
jgi:glycosyltransferase involved in cell wall biosynthesis